MEKEDVNLGAVIEAVLFASSKPRTYKQIAKLVKTSESRVQEILEGLRREKNTPNSGVHVLEHEGSVQFVTNPAFAEILSRMSKDEVSGDLTRPQLETLTIVCYRGPITKPEIEQIRGVNCTIILRNLMVRGLVEEKEDTTKILPVYIATSDFLRHLGLTHIKDLADYERFNSDERITQLIEDAMASDM